MSRDLGFRNLREKRRQQVLAFASNEGSCVPKTAELIGENDGFCEVWKVTVMDWDKDWEVDPPDFWWVCVGGATNLYRSDMFNKSVVSIDEVDYIRSFHVGFVTRLLKEQPSVDVKRKKLSYA